MFVAALSSRANASGILFDPATLHIGTGAGTACATGCGGDPNVITSTDLSIYQNQGGGDDLLIPTLLIIGIPDYNGTAPTISDVVEYDPYPTTNVGSVSVTGGANDFGLNTGTFFGQWPSDSTDDVYAFLGLAGNNSNNTTNWFSGPNATADFFGIYVYSIEASLGAKGLFDVTFGGSGLPAGSIAIAYGCTAIDTETGACASEGDTYSTPFTEAGRVESTEVTETTENVEITEITETTENVEITPEPATLVLFGSGLAIAAARLRRRRQIDNV
jgi:hypothetical protein